MSLLLLQTNKMTTLYWSFNWTIIYIYGHNTVLSLNRETKTKNYVFYTLYRNAARVHALVHTRMLSRAHV